MLQLSILVKSIELLNFYSIDHNYCMEQILQPNSISKPTRLFHNSVAKQHS